jgi:hypothetical protein
LPKIIHNFPPSTQVSTRSIFLAPYIRLLRPDYAPRVSKTMQHFQGHSLISSILVFKGLSGPRVSILTALRHHQPLHPSHSRHDQQIHSIARQTAQLHTKMLLTPDLTRLNVISSKDRRHVHEACARPGISDPIRRQLSSPRKEKAKAAKQLMESRRMRQAKHKHRFCIYA